MALLRLTTNQGDTLSRQKVEELKARARTITTYDIKVIVGKQPKRIDVTEACEKVCVEIHMGEDMPAEAGQYTYKILKFLAQELRTELLDLRPETFADGCDTCSNNRDLGWEIWCRP